MTLAGCIPVKKVPRLSVAARYFRNALIKNMLRNIYGLQSYTAAQKESIDESMSRPTWT